jgi:hypothetical protein
VTTGFDLVDDLVAVHWLFGEQRENCDANIAAPHAWRYASLEFVAQIIEGIPEAETWLAR